MRIKRRAKGSQCANGRFGEGYTHAQHSNDHKNNGHRRFAWQVAPITLPNGISPNSTPMKWCEADNHRKQPDQQKRSLNWGIANENLKQRQIYGQRDDRPQLFLEAYAAIRHKERTNALAGVTLIFSGLKDFHSVGSGFGVRRL